MVVERLSTLLAVELLPPEYPQRWRDRDLSSWMEWKVLEVPVLCLGMVPVGLCLTGLLAAIGGPGGLDCLVLVPVGTTAAAFDPCGCLVAGDLALRVLKALQPPLKLRPFRACATGISSSSRAPLPLCLPVAQPLQ